jgi:hypothetical protein
MTTLTQYLLSASLLALLTACGGGGGGDGDGDGDEISLPNIPDGKTSITLSWTTPAARENGSPLANTEISGYEIYYFLQGDDNTAGNITSISKPYPDESTTLELDPGTYYFALTTVDTQGLFSDNSDFVVIVIE